MKTGLLIAGVAAALFVLYEIFKSPVAGTTPALALRGTTVQPSSSIFGTSPIYGTPVISPSASATIGSGIGGFLSGLLSGGAKFAQTIAGPQNQTPKAVPVGYTAAAQGPTYSQLIDGNPASPSPILTNGNLPLPQLSPSQLVSLNGDPGVTAISDVPSGVDYPGIQSYMIDPNAPDPNAYVGTGDVVYS